MVSRSVVRLRNLLIVGALAILPASGAAAEERKFCGKLVSPQGTYSAALVLVDPGVAAKRRVNVFLCDTAYNCDVVFVSAPDLALGIIWRGNSELVIAGRAGSIQPPGQVDSIGSGRPKVKIVRSISSRGAQLGNGWHSFVQRNCAAQPPVVQIVTKGKS